MKPLWTTYLMNVENALGRFATRAEYPIVHAAWKDGTTRTSQIAAQLKEDENR